MASWYSKCASVQMGQNSRQQIQKVVGLARVSNYEKFASSSERTLIASIFLPFGLLVLLRRLSKESLSGSFLRWKKNGFIEMPWPKLQKSRSQFFGKFLKALPPHCANFFLALKMLNSPSRLKSETRLFVARVALAEAIASNPKNALSVSARPPFQALVRLLENRLSAKNGINGK